MAKITYLTTDNEYITLEAAEGSVMELAVRHGVKGIDGDCGGVCSCATCHVRVAPEYWAQVGKPGEIEMDMLELNDNVSEFSRLGCQIQISEALDGVTFKVAR